MQTFSFVINEKRTNKNFVHSYFIGAALNERKKNENEKKKTKPIQKELV